MENIGWLGSILLAFCGLPQAVESYKTKSSEGLTWGFIGMWFIGEICTFIYILPKMDLPLLLNYTANIIFLAVIIFYKMLPKSK
jgi:uncharacterized protein with PQ loop repeat